MIKVDLDHPHTKFKCLLNFKYISNNYQFNMKIIKFIIIIIINLIQQNLH